jgi:formate-dependent nitrite reductase membrane component NrfD
VRRPEKETKPKLFYKGAHQVTLDPIAAARPSGGLFMWSEQPAGSGTVVSGHPVYANSSAAALLSYDVPHKMPWDWRVSLYTWTKSLAVGAYLVPLLLVSFGVLPDQSIVWQWIAPLVAAFFLACTGALLIADLEHPTRFYFIFTRSQWKSWLVRGGYIIAGYSTVLAVHLAGTLIGNMPLQRVLMLAGAPLAVMTAAYTAYLFAQAKARDLWQNPLLPAHLAIQAVLAGAAVMLPFAQQLEPNSVTTLLWILASSGTLHLLLVAGEATLTHSTAHAGLAQWHMVRGRYAAFFWAGVVLTLPTVAAPWLGVHSWGFALLAVLAHEHAYVQAGQAVPLA